MIEVDRRNSPIWSENFYPAQEKFSGHGGDLLLPYRERNLFKKPLERNEERIRVQIARLTLSSFSSLLKELERIYTIMVWALLDFPCFLIDFLLGKSIRQNLLDNHHMMMYNLLHREK